MLAVGLSVAVLLYPLPSNLCNAAGLDTMTFTVDAIRYSFSYM